MLLRHDLNIYFGADDAELLFCCKTYPQHSMFLSQAVYALLYQLFVV
jgi:hypothetical protein